MNKLNKRPKWLSIFLIFIGSGMIAAATSIFYDPVGMVTGGFSGVSIIIRDITNRVFNNGGIPLWITNVVLNVPLFLFAFKKHGGMYLLRTFWAVSSMSVWLMLLPTIAPVSHDLFLTSVFGGVLTGIGLGLVLASNSTTGGTDMLAVLIHDKIKDRFTISQVIQIIDGIIIVIGLMVFGIISSLYAIISLYITLKITDGILEGIKFAKAVFIITTKPDDIAKAIMISLDRGVTAIDCIGMYSKHEKTMLLCVVAKRQVVSLRRAVYLNDPTAFVIISDVREVFGEGFLESD